MLGLQTDELAGLTTEELTSNPTAIKMMLHYYRQLVDDNSTLKNDNNTLKTYVDAYNVHKSNSSIGAILLALSNVLVGFGVNLVTINSDWPGGVCLFVGVCLAFAGIYFSFRKAA